MRRAWTSAPASVRMIDSLPLICLLQQSSTSVSSRFAWSRGASRQRRSVYISYTFSSTTENIVLKKMYLYAHPHRRHLHQLSGVQVHSVYCLVQGLAPQVGMDAAVQAGVDAQVLAAECSYSSSGSTLGSRRIRTCS